MLKSVNGSVEQMTSKKVFHYRALLFEEEQHKQLGVVMQFSHVQHQDEYTDSQP